MKWTIITRTNGLRPRELARCKESVNKQVVVAEHIILQLGECGLEAANNAIGALAGSDIQGDYVIILDDDDYLAPGVLRQLEDWISQNAIPPVIFTLWEAIGCCDNQIMPPRRMRGAKPQYGFVGPLNLVVRKDMFHSCIHAFAQPRGGDYFYASELWEYCNKHWIWLDLVLGYHDKEASVCRRFT